MSFAIATSLRPRGGSTCIAAHCSASSPSAPRNRSDLEAAAGIEVLLQAKCCGAREGEHHGFAACRRQPLLDAFTHEFGAIAIGEDEPCLFGNDLAREIRTHREIEPVAILEIILPLRIGP